MTETDRINKIIEISSKTGLTIDQIIYKEIQEWLQSPIRKDMVLGERYYRCEVGTDAGKDIILKDGIVRKLVKQKTDYLLSKPFSIDAQNDKYLSLLNDTFSNAFFRQIKKLGKEAVNKGLGWLHVSFEDSKLVFSVIPSEDVIPLWSDSAHTILDGIIYLYRREEYSGTTKELVTHVEYWDSTGVKRYIYNMYGLVPDVEMGDSSHFAVNGTPYNWQRVPFVAFKYNDDEMPLIHCIQSLVDDYNGQKATIANLLKDVPNFIYILKNYGGTDLAEFITGLSEYRAIKTEGDGGVDKLQADINISAFDTYQSIARKDIYEFGRGVDTQSADLGNASGVALKFRYADLDMDCNDMDTEFSAALQDLLYFVNYYYAIMGYGNFSGEQVDFVFNRDIIINEEEAIQECMASKDIISDETIVANHPWVTDAQEELKKLKQQREETAKEQQSNFGMVLNTPPGGDTVEE